MSWNWVPTFWYINHETVKVQNCKKKKCEKAIWCFSWPGSCFHPWIINNFKHLNSLYGRQGERKTERQRGSLHFARSKSNGVCFGHSHFLCRLHLRFDAKNMFQHFKSYSHPKPLVSEINERRPITKRSKRSKNLPCFERLKHINNLWLFPMLMLWSTLSVSMIRFEILTNNTRMQRVDRDSRVLEISGQLLGVQDVGELRLAVSSKASPRVRSLKVEIGPGKQQQIFQTV